MPAEFLGIAATNDGSETTARSGGAFDREYTLRLARAHEDHGWDRVLFAYGSGTPDPAPAAAYIASRLDRLQILLAHRPNAGNSNALVGTPETVAKALLDYYDLGVDILSARGYDLLGDAVDFGRYVIPIVREEVAKRDAEIAADVEADRETAHAARPAHPHPAPVRG
ncbi:LLM class flavin-dependent oxidoreductase [Streptomyces sp. NPDC058655]|uniref:LLM class flavin-dependent oxidoreductase n=1 Tax=unclassified Streptomyces TaxID=2593676 RepID=UPI0036499B8C